MTALGVKPWRGKSPERLSVKRTADKQQLEQEYTVNSKGLVQPSSPSTPVVQDSKDNEQVHNILVCSSFRMELLCAQLTYARREGPAELAEEHPDASDERGTRRMKNVPKYGSITRGYRLHTVLTSVSFQPLERAVSL
jgi:hypothetical protein